MIAEHIRYVLTDSAPDDLVAAYQVAAQHLQAAPECLGYDMTQCDEEPNVFLLTIHWSSARDHMEGFRRGPHFPPFLAAIRPFLGEIAEMRHYSPTALKWQR